MAAGIVILLRACSKDHSADGTAHDILQVSVYLTDNPAYSDKAQVAIRSIDNYVDTCDDNSRSGRDDDNRDADDDNSGRGSGSDDDDDDNCRGRGTGGNE